MQEEQSLKPMNEFRSEFYVMSTAFTPCFLVCNKAIGELIFSLNKVILRVACLDPNSSSS